MDGKSFHTQLKFSYSKHLDEVEYGVHDSHTVYSKKKKKNLQLNKAQPSDWATKLNWTE